MHQLPEFEQNDLRTIDSTAARIRLRRRHLAARRRSKRLARLALAGGALTLFLLAGSWLATATVAGRRALPGVAVRTIDLSWRTADEAQTLIDQSYRAF